MRRADLPPGDARPRRAAGHRRADRRGRAGVRRGGVPFVARGSGTGLSGGALPRTDGVLIVTSRMRRILEIDIAAAAPSSSPASPTWPSPRRSAPLGLLLRARPVQPAGLLHRRERGGELRRRALPEVRLHRAPRHSACEIVTPRRRADLLGDGTGATPGYDLLGAFIGVEGTLGIATKITVRLTRMPETVHDAAGRVRTIGQGGAAVSAIIGAGILPARDRDDGRAGHRGGRGGGGVPVPAGAGAVLIVELDGPAAEVERETAEVRAALRADRRVRDPDRRRRRPSGPRSGPAASPPSPRWAGSARPTSCRTAWCRGPRSPGRPGPDRRAVAGAAASGWPTSSTPATATCIRWCCSTTSSRAPASAAEEVSGKILDLCIEHGGSITGEHGVGVGQVAVHDRDVHRRRPRHHAAGALRLRPCRPVQPRQDLPHPPAVRGGARASARASTRWSPPARAEQF